MKPMDKEQFLSRISQALNLPIQSRCAELTVLFDRGTLKDIQRIFPVIIDSIFGPQGTMSWNLRSITSAKNPSLFQAVHFFLSPIGPLLRLVYLLLNDPTIRYDFNLGLLPTKVRQNLEVGNIPLFYADLLQFNPQTKQLISLSLNPFDYYMFHFAYHLINPCHQRTTGSLTSNWSSVYYILCCDYALHFLPTNPGTEIEPDASYYLGKVPAQTSAVINSPPKHVKLLRPNFVKEPNSEFNYIQQSEKHPRSYIWRSETILTIFSDIWLNNDQILMSSTSFRLNPNRTFHCNELPSGEYIRIVRVFVKQIHSFASSGKADASHLGELKRMCLQMIQGKMYVFLRNLMHQWPLDGSFRLVLELWLSFIQPWRYPGNAYLKHLNLPEANPEPTDENSSNTVVDREYLPFIAENLLAYIVIFQQLLPRFIRVDLSSPKNALMLYRLTKVFNQPNLVFLLREIEGNLINLKGTNTHNFGKTWIPNLPPLLPTSAWSTNDTSYFDSSIFSAQKQMDASSTFCNDGFKISSGKFGALIKNKIFELEGPTFNYKPLFLGPPAKEVHELLNQIALAYTGAKNILNSRMLEIKQTTGGIFGCLKSFFYLGDNSNDEFTLEEREKVPMYLEFSHRQLTSIFNIKNMIELDATEEINSRSCSCTSENDISLLLTPEKIKERIKKIKYEGDPDLHPIRSHESKFLVRVLYMLSSKLNEKYQPQIYRLYYSPTFFGRLSRQILQPPLTAYRFDKTVIGSPRIEEKLPPRLSLRYFASHKVILFIIVTMLAAYIKGYNPILLLFYFFVLWFLYLCFKTLCNTSVDLSPPPGNLTFDASY